MMVPSFAAGARLAAHRLRDRGTVAVVASTWSLAAAVAFLQSERDLLGAPTQALRFTTSLVLPLAALAFARTVVGRLGLAELTWWSGRLGLSRRGVALGAMVALLGWGALTWATTATIVLTGAYRGAPGFGADVVATLPVVAMGGVAYGAWFAWGATALTRGRGVWLMAAVDLVLGSAPGALSWVVPRTHIEHLVLGTPAVIAAAWRPPMSFVALALVTAVATVAVALRTRP
ncbi:MAG: hypothetical protein AAGA56_01860 [Myxococcota bacterium]